MKGLKLKKKKKIAINEVYIQYSIQFKILKNRNSFWYNVNNYRLVFVKSLKSWEIKLCGNKWMSEENIGVGSLKIRGKKDKHKNKIEFKFLYP